MFKILIICYLTYFATCMKIPEHDSDGDGESVAEAAVSVGLYLTAMAGKELGVDQLQAQFAKTQQELKNETPGKYAEKLLHFKEIQFNGSSSRVRGFVVFQPTCLTFPLLF